MFEVPGDLVPDVVVPVSRCDDDFFFYGGQVVLDELKEHFLLFVVDDVFDVFPVDIHAVQ